MRLFLFKAPIKHGKNSISRNERFPADGVYFKNFSDTQQEYNLYIS